MHIYHVELFGRPIGAIGIFHHCTLKIQSAEVLDAEQIRTRCYDTHEHISGIRFEEVRDDENAPQST